MSGRRPAAAAVTTTEPGIDRSTRIELALRDLLSVLATRHQEHDRALRKDCGLCQSRDRAYEVLNGATSGETAEYIAWKLAVLEQERNDG